MLTLFVELFCVNITEARISLLARGYLAFLITIICFIVLRGWRFTIWVSCLLIPKSNGLLALTNSLFLIHPPLLYIAVIGLVFSGLSAGRNKPVRYFLVTIVCAVYMGGWWAMQELSWGGWWNWDTLETNILLTILSIIWIFHRSISRSERRSYTLLARIITSSSFMLNKSGLGGSIHNFTPTSIQVYHYFIIIFWGLVCCGLINAWRKLPLSVIVSFISIYTQVDTSILGKLVSIFILIWVQLLVYQKWWLHIIFYIIAMSINILNFNHLVIVAVSPNWYHERAWLFQKWLQIEIRNYLTAVQNIHQINWLTKLNVHYHMGFSFSHNFHKTNFMFQFIR